MNQIKYYLLSLVIVVLTALPAHAEEALNFAKQYIYAIGSESSQDQYASYMIQPIQDQFKKKPEKKEREFQTAVRMHETFLEDGSIETTPSASSKMNGKIMVYTYTLNNTYPMTRIYPKSSMTDFVLTEYQIVMQQENDTWKVTGESFVGTQP